MRVGKILSKNQALILILVLGLALRLVNINQSLWLDEGAQAQLSSQTLFQIWSGRGGDFHPPLFYFMAHFWLNFGRSETWLRLLPISFSVTNIFVIYVFAQKLFSRGLLAAFLLAIAPFHIYYAQEFRSYSLLCLLGTLSMYFLYQKKYFWLTLTNTLLLYTHYSSLFLILTQLLINPRTIRYTLFSFLLYIPWLPQFLSQLQSGANVDQYLPGWRNVLSIAPLKAFPVTIFKLVAGRINFLNRYLYGLYIVFTFGVTFLAMYIAQSQKRLLLTWAVTPIFIMLVVSFVFPQNQPFRVIYVLPALILLFTSAATRFPKTFLTFIIYLSLVGNMAYFTKPRLQREQWRQASQFLVSQSSPVIVKFPGSFAPLTWYAPTLQVVPAMPSLPLLPSLPSSKIFLMEYLTGLTDPNRQIDFKLRDLGYIEVKIHNFEGVGFIYELTRQ